MTKNNSIENIQRTNTLHNNMEKGIKIAASVKLLIKLPTDKVLQLEW